MLQQECVRLEITAYPSPPRTPPPPPPPKQDRSALKKYKFSRRTIMLAVPKRITSKFEPIPVVPSSATIKVEEEFELDPGVEWRSKQLSYPTVRFLTVNKKYCEKAKLSPKLVKHIDKHLKNTWNSIYNYYTKRLLAKKLKRLQRKAAKSKGKQQKGKKGKKAEELEKERTERYNKLSRPKPVPKQEKIPKKWKPLEQLLENVNILAAPKEYNIEPPRDITKIASSTQTYEPTAAVLRLAELPPRMKIKEEAWPPWPTGVNPSAKFAIVTDRILELCKPSHVASKAKKEEEEQETWTVNPKALKYKATPRILELAKPSERE